MASEMVLISVSREVAHRFVSDNAPLSARVELDIALRAALLENNGLPDGMIEHAASVVAEKFEWPEIGHMDWLNAVEATLCAAREHVPE